MRTFIAIFLPKEILDYLYEVENKLKKELPAKIDLDKIGVFPNEEFIRVIWIGLKSKELGDLQRLIDYELLDLFSKEQDFISHLTLGRIKNIQDKEKFKKALQIKIEDKEFEINEFCLVKSELHKEGPSYEILER